MKIKRKFCQMCRGSYSKICMYVCIKNIISSKPKNKLHKQYQADIKKLITILIDNDD